MKEDSADGVVNGQKRVSYGLQAKRDLYHSMKRASLMEDSIDENQVTCASLMPYLSVCLTAGLFRSMLL